MSFPRDLKVLWHLALAPVRGATHAERLSSFYAGQAADYDDFRRRLLQGREELLGSLSVAEGSAWLDMGGGTGSNLEQAPWLAGCRSATVVDLCRPLLEQCRLRIDRHGWSNVSVVEADATTYAAPAPVDLVTFSYSLTMIPDWFAAIDRAWHNLRPGGQLAVVDFHVSRKYPGAGLTRHGWLTRSLLPVWFATDNVHLSRDHIPYLQQRFETVRLEERLAPIPYVPFWKAPYYLFVGRKGTVQAAAGLPSASSPAAAG
ncbi:MAG TPA: SAM-dependent methyltransferase [Planctomycetaceae bacterium]|jgi:S-adenosylmethionine-diacylgycerolhomoserine-N-methlytransferase|nr:SAM-dependent methyltransferase [Planctomycetaceae bacterium]